MLEWQRYDVTADAFVIRLQIGEHYVDYPALEGRKAREARQSALDALEAAVARDLQPGPVMAGRK